MFGASPELASVMEFGFYQLCHTFHTDVQIRYRNRMCHERLGYETCPLVWRLIWTPQAWSLLSLYYLYVVCYLSLARECQNYLAFGISQISKMALLFPSKAWVTNLLTYFDLALFCSFAVSFLKVLKAAMSSGLSCPVLSFLGDRLYKNSSGDEIANVNFYAVRPEGTRIRWNNAK